MQVRILPPQLDGDRPIKQNSRNGVARMKIDEKRPIEIDVHASPDTGGLVTRARTLSAGLNFLYGRVRVAELNLSQKLEEAMPGMRQHIFGNHPALNEIRQDLIECSFHWYSVSACNFVKLIAFTAKMEKADREEYEKTVLGAVKPFRDKVGAHIAGATANTKDNRAEQQFSAYLPLAWNDDRFFAGSHVLGLKNDQERVDSSVIGPWSLTQVHESLCERFPIIAEQLPVITKRSE